jgi:uncharacterized protein
MRLAILADTHLPKGVRRLPAACVERLRAADLIVHAGDFSTRAVLDELRSLGEVAAVHGNVDDRALRRELPEEMQLELPAGVRLAVLHDAGPARGRLARAARRFPHAHALVFGHSHLPLHEVDTASGFQLFNPGSPTERRRAPSHTMGLAEVRDGRMHFELVDLDAAARADPATH